MAQLSDDCFAFGGPLMTAAEALALLDQRLVCVAEPERVKLRASRGRILAADVTATRAVPPHDNSAVDGYAVFWDDLARAAETSLPVAGRLAAGSRLERPAERGTAIRIFTGAPMPQGPDTVAMQEDCHMEGERVVIPPGLKRGANRRRAGEDVQAGSVILRAGRRLRPQDIGLAASVGWAELAVYRPLKAAVFSTGDELRDVGEAPQAGCVFDANRHALIAALEGQGCVVADLGILADEADAVREALARAAADHDLIVTSGGMSTGEEDHMRAAVTALGRIHFWRLAVRPGRPVAFGQVGRVPFIGLPGNPAAMMVMFMTIARPAILKLAGATEGAPHLFRVRADFGYRKKASRREWLRVRLYRDADGMLACAKFPREGAGILTSMVEADGLVELPEGMEDLSPGMMVEFLPFSEVS
ncbi:MAG: molybdopterin molybdenumtransferase MoeA [Rhodospirillales bacterium]|nr:molybdopterin molybdenumtransferase MoeA [Rhodospirillales bacterium]